jgi:hypothetical protein
VTIDLNIDEKALNNVKQDLGPSTFNQQKELYID